MFIDKQQPQHQQSQSLHGYQHLQQQPPTHQHQPLQSFSSIKQQQHHRLSCDDFSGIMTTDLVDTGGESSSAEEIWDLDSNTVKRYTAPLDTVSDLSSDPSTLGGAVNNMQYNNHQQQTIPPNLLSPNASDHNNSYQQQILTLTMMILS